MNQIVLSINLRNASSEVTAAVMPSVGSEATPHKISDSRECRATRAFNQVFMRKTSTGRRSRTVPSRAFRKRYKWRSQRQKRSSIPQTCKNQTTTKRARTNTTTMGVQQLPPLMGRIRSPEMSARIIIGTRHSSRPLASILRWTQRTASKLSNNAHLLIRTLSDCFRRQLDWILWIPWLLETEILWNTPRLWTIKRRISAQILSNVLLHHLSLYLLRQFLSTLTIQTQPHQKWTYLIAQLSSCPLRNFQRESTCEITSLTSVRVWSSPALPRAQRLSPAWVKVSKNFSSTLLKMHPLATSQRGPRSLLSSQSSGMQAIVRAKRAKTSSESASVMSPSRAKS